MTMHRKAVALMDPIEAVARLAASAQARAESAQTRASGSASFDNADGTRTVIGPQTGSATMATHVGDVTPPGRPLGVAGASSAGVVYVAWGGELEGGIPADFDRVSVYMSVEGVSEFVGTLTEAGIVSTVPMATTATVEVWATSEDDACLADGTPAHNVSAESDHATVKVTQAEDRAAVDALRDRLSKVEATAEGLSTLIREGEDGITVGKSADGKTWSTGRTRMTDSAFQVLDKAGAVIAQMAKDGASFLAGLVKIVVGTGTLPGNKTANFIRVDAGSGVVGLSGIISRLDATIEGITSSLSAGWEQDFGYGVTAIVRESNTVASAAYLAPDKCELTVGSNQVTMTPDGYALSKPSALRAAVGSYGPVSPSSPYGSLTFCVRAGVATLWVSWGTTADPWGKAQCGEWVIPEAYRPRMDLNAPVALANRGTGDTGDTRLIVEASTGKVLWQNLGGGHSATTFDALLSWGIE